MPLTKGSSRGVIASNIREMQASGHPHNVAVAAALHTAHPKVRPNHRDAAKKLAAYRKSRRGSAPAGARSTQARSAAKAPRRGGRY